MLLRMLLLLLLMQRQAQRVMPKRVVLFVCVENAGRSLMAEAMFNAEPPPGWRATSAGTRPAAAPHPRTVVALKELGLELPPHPPMALTSELMDESSVRVTMGCLDDASCPALLQSIEVQDWGLEDPSRLDDKGFRRVRDDLYSRVRKLRVEIIRSERKAADRLGTAGR